MSGITYEYMEQYIRGMITEHTGILKELENFAKENSVPIVQKEAARFLEFMVNIKKPQKILELGTAIGYSAILMHTASSGKSIIKTIERDPDMVQIARMNIEKYGLSNMIEVLEGDCLDQIKKIDDSFDIIFIDAGKGHYNHFLPYCLKLLKKDGIIIADNVLFRGMVASKELVKRRKITIVKRMQNYLDMVSHDSELITSVIPMGDGIAITTRRNTNE